jgi:hypothetical protein
MLHLDMGSWSVVRTFRLDAAAARRLAATFRQPQAIRDLTDFADTLEKDADELERTLLDGNSRLFRKSDIA